MAIVESTVAAPRVRPERGFTLLELMLALTVAGVLLTVGVPSFVDMVRNNRAATNVNELLTAMASARSESIRRGQAITVCRSANSTTCGGTWANGWIVFRDDAATETGAPVVGDVLRTWPEMPGNATVTTFANGVAADVEWVRFAPRGGVRAAVALPIRMDIRLEGCLGQQMRRVELNTVGRATVTREAC